MNNNFGFNMTVLRLTLVATALTALTACGLSQEAATSSGFRTPSASGVLTSGIDVSQRRTSTLSDNNGGGVAMVSGTRGDDGFAAYAGVIPGTDVGASGVSGSATFVGRYRAAQIVDINLTKTSNTTGFLTGTSNIFGDDITLTADFDAATLTGTSDNQVLSVNGQIGSGTTLGGSVRYLGVSGVLQGVVGVDGAVGAFHGNNAETIFAGGFVTAPQAQ